MSWTSPLVINHQSSANIAEWFTPIIQCGWLTRIIHSLQCIVTHRWNITNVWSILSSVNVCKRISGKWEILLNLCWWMQSFVDMRGHVSIVPWVCNDLGMDITTTVLVHDIIWGKIKDVYNASTFGTNRYYWLKCTCITMECLGISRGGGRGRHLVL